MSKKPEPIQDFLRRNFPKITEELEYTCSRMKLPQEDTPVSDFVYQKTCNILYNLAQYTYFRGYRLPCPEVNICPDGTLDISWRTPSTSLLMNISTDIGNEFYGQVQGNQEIEGYFETLEDVVYLCSWVEQYLCEPRKWVGNRFCTSHLSEPSGPTSVKKLISDVCEKFRMRCL